MKKWFTLVLLICSIMYGEDLPIFNVISQNMILDQKNIITYSSMNVFDKHNDTVYAVDYSLINVRAPLFRIYFTENVKLQSISLSAGYFDSKYYPLNNRIKTISIELRKGTKTIFKKENIQLKDEMKSQLIDLGSNYECSELHIYITDIYKGSKWNDLVISEIGFNTENTNVIFSSHGKNVYTEVYDYYNIQNGLIVKENTQYGKSGDEVVFNYYSPENKLILQIIRAMQDPEEDMLKEYFYANVNDKNPFMTSLRNFNGQNELVTKFTYSNGKKSLEENINEKIEYKYELDKLVEVKNINKKTNNVESITKYYYLDNKICAEKYESYENSKYSYILQYVYDKDMLLSKIPIFSIGYGSTKDGESYPNNVVNIYEDNELIGFKEYSHLQNWGYFEE